MRNIRNFVIFLMVICFGAIYAQAPASTDVDMADTMRSSGKIYVVVGVVLIILVGLLIYLITIDRKVSKIEKEIMEGKK